MLPVLGQASEEIEPGMQDQSRPMNLSLPRANMPSEIWSEPPANSDMHQAERNANGRKQSDAKEQGNNWRDLSRNVGTGVNYGAGFAVRQRDGVGRRGTGRGR